MLTIFMTSPPFGERPAGMDMSAAAISIFCAGFMDFTGSFMPTFGDFTPDLLPPAFERNEVADPDADTRSLTRTDCGSADLASEPDDIGEEDPGIDDGLDAGFAGAAEPVWALAAFNVSSTSTSIQPAPMSADFMASRETPSFICDETYSTS